MVPFTIILAILSFLAAYTEAVRSPNDEFYAESLLKHLQKTRHFIFLLSNSLISIWPL